MLDASRGVFAQFVLFTVFVVYTRGNIDPMSLHRLGLFRIGKKKKVAKDLRERARETTTRIILVVAIAVADTGKLLVSCLLLLLRTCWWWVNLR